jgi:hypothetical protein
VFIFLFRYQFEIGGIKSVIDNFTLDFGFPDGITEAIFSMCITVIIYLRAIYIISFAIYFTARSQSVPSKPSLHWPQEASTSISFWWDRVVCSTIFLLCRRSCELRQKAMINSIFFMVLLFILI